MAKKTKKSGGLFRDYSKITYLIVLIIIAAVAFAAFVAGHNHLLLPSKSPTSEETTYITTTQAAGETTTTVIEDATEEVEETTTTTTATTEEASTVDESELIGEDAAYQAAIKHLNVSDDDITWHSQTLMQNWLYNKKFKTAYMVTFYAPSDDVSDSRHVVIVDATNGDILKVVA